jgi:IS30 family transposase
LKIYSSFGDNAAKIFKSITSEFTKLSATLPSSTSIYYAHPYSSAERGTNKKLNSLVRYFYAKGKSFDDVSEDSISRVEDWINNLQRKFAEYLTSNELFGAELVNLGIISYNLENVRFDIAIYNYFVLYVLTGIQQFL